MDNIDEWSNNDSPGNEIAWKKIEMSDRELINSYYEKEQPRSCEYTFANNILWSPHYQVKYAAVEDNLVFIVNKTKLSVSFPIGRGNIKKTIETMKAYFAEIGKPFVMHGVTAEQFERLEALFPGVFQIEYDRDSADYIYESEKLIALSGKKLHAKRNHINKFKEEHPEWSYEPITAENRDDCLAMAEQWCIENGCAEEDDEEKYYEFCVTINALKRMEELNLKGGLIRIQDKVVAFAIGEASSEDTFVVHIEKAYADIQGAYPMINQQFVEHEASDYLYINREEDMGVEGLRKAKLSYRPIFLQEKGKVTPIV